MKNAITYFTITTSVIAILLIGFFSNSMLNTVIQFFTSFLLMMVTGVFWGPWFALTRNLKSFSGEEFTKIAKVMASHMGLGMRILIPFCFALMLFSVWVYPQKDSLGFYLCLTSVFFIVLAIIITITTELPAVNKIVAWNIVPEDWELVRDNWVFFHVFRVFSGFLSFACYTASILFLQI